MKVRSDPILASTEGSEGLKRTLVTDSAEVENVISITEALLGTIRKVRYKGRKRTLSHPILEQLLKKSQIRDQHCDDLWSYRRYLVSGRNTNKSTGTY